jgi:DNA segregation ATPase FtsK/SpoIIIE-like protein
MTGAQDPLYEQAVAIVREHKRGSISLVQRHLQIGYNRAYHMIDAMVGTVLTDMPPIGKVIPAERPLCAVRGLIRPGAMCGSVIVGGELCGFKGKCEHQRAACVTEVSRG